MMKMEGKPCIGYKSRKKTYVSTLMIMDVSFSVLDWVFCFYRLSISQKVALPLDTLDIMTNVTLNRVCAKYPNYSYVVL